MAGLYDIVKPIKGSGIFVRGQNGVSKKELFDALEGKINEFYQRNGEIAVVPFLEDGVEKYSAEVYVDDTDKIEITNVLDKNGMVTDQKTKVPKSQKTGYVNISFLAPETRDEFEKDWDFAHSPLHIEKQKIWIYFTVLGKDFKKDEYASVAKRDAFLKYFSNTQNI